MVTIVEHDPPGTRKSELDCTMTSYLKFRICDLELTNLQSNLELRRLLLVHSIHTCDRGY